MRAEVIPSEKRAELEKARDRFNRAMDAHLRRPTSTTSLTLAQAREGYHAVCAEVGVRTPPEVRALR